jgi:hypothetical protein
LKVKGIIWMGDLSCLQVFWVSVEWLLLEQQLFRSRGESNPVGAGLPAKAMFDPLNVL